MKYEEPKLELIEFLIQDIVTASGGLADGSDEDDIEPASMF